MAEWNIVRKRNKILLFYNAKPLDPKSDTVACGKGTVAMLDDVLGFVSNAADPYDIIKLPDGRQYMRQPDVAGQS